MSMAPRARRARAVPAADPMIIHFLATRCTMRTLARTPRRPAMAMMMGAARDTSKAVSPLEVASPSELLLFGVAIITYSIGTICDTDMTSQMICTGGGVGQNEYNAREGGGDEMFE